MVSLVTNSLECYGHAAALGLLVPLTAGQMTTCHHVSALQSCTSLTSTPH